MSPARLMMKDLFPLCSFIMTVTIPFVPSGRRHGKALECMDWNLEWEWEGKWELLAASMGRINL